MAIVLPQGRLNNSSESAVREYLVSRSRVIATVSLHLNTFKPHTNTKTTVIFVQKWNEDPKAGPLNPQIDNYPVFMAVSRNGGKDSAGSYVYEPDTLGKPKLDAHGHAIIDHDLNRIAEEFQAFAQKHKLSFAPSVS